MLDGVIDSVYQKGISNVEWEKKVGKFYRGKTSYRMRMNFVFSFLFYKLSNASKSSSNIEKTMI